MFNSLGHLGHQFEKISLTQFSLLEIVPPKFFVCFIEVLILWEIMTSSEMIFQFEEMIGVLT